MRRPSYREAIAWIALNDDAGSDVACETTFVKQMISVALVADLFGKTDLEVAQKVVQYRERT